MTYEEAREFITYSNQYGSVLGLETITELLNRLGNPQDSIKIIHVAGTNGKGSTSAFIATILAAEDYRVGRYISPSVFSYRERIQITSGNDSGNGSIEILNDYITRNGVVDSITIIKEICETMIQDGFSHPTSFEIETAMAMLYLAKEKVDFAVFEVGLGGRLDATNVIQKPVCSVITSISMDHMQILGDTIGKIAFEKAGIIKAGIPVVTSNREPEVLQVIEQVCQEKKALLHVVEPKAIRVLGYSPEGTRFYYDSIVKSDTMLSDEYQNSEIQTSEVQNRKFQTSEIQNCKIHLDKVEFEKSQTKDINTHIHVQPKEYQIQLLGEYQVMNAVLAINTIQVLRNLGYTISDGAVYHGLLLTKWRGRFEIIARKPYVVIDGAHNEDAAIRLSQSIPLYFSNRRIIYVMGVLADKDYHSILRITSCYPDLIITLTPDNSRALSSAKLAEAAKEYCKQVIDADNVHRAVELAFREAKEEDVIIAFGSLSFLGDLVKHIDIRKEEETNDR